VTTTTIPTTNEDVVLWSGLVSFSVDPDCTLDYLAGAQGGYVNAVCSANSEAQFLQRVFLFLDERQLTLKNCTQISRVTLVPSGEELSAEWKELSAKAIKSGNVECTTFHLFGSTEEGPMLE
jgi:hypothetical protein